MTSVMIVKTLSEGVVGLESSDAFVDFEVAMPSGSREGFGRGHECSCNAWILVAHSGRVLPRGDELSMEGGRFEEKIRFERALRVTSLISANNTMALAQARAETKNSKPGSM